MCVCVRAGVCVCVCECGRAGVCAFLVFLVFCVCVRESE